MAVDPFDINRKRHMKEISDETLSRENFHADDKQKSEQAIKDITAKLKEKDFPFPLGSTDKTLTCNGEPHVGWYVDSHYHTGAVYLISIKPDKSDEDEDEPDRILHPVLQRDRYNREVTLFDLSQANQDFLGKIRNSLEMILQKLQADNPRLARDKQSRMVDYT